MKKVPNTKQPRQISKQAFQIAKGAASTADAAKIGRVADVLTAKNERNDEDLPLNEAEIMGEAKAGHKSNASEKNLGQMVNVLKTRLKVLSEATKLKFQLCEEDLNPNSIKKSEDFKAVDEFEETIPKALKEFNKVPEVAAHKDNLVTSDKVQIDPYHLVLRTKPALERGKKIEANLEESYGNINLRELKNKKSKGLNQTEKSKKSEQLKNEAKRINRLKIEKKLQANMDNIVMRTVTDIIFVCPERITDECKWPISVKWSSRDPRSKMNDKNDGEFDADLLLRYSLERINLPSGKKMFSWLIRQPMMHSYFLALFWLIKVKFYEHDRENVEESEAYLLNMLGHEYRKIVEMLASRAHAEHEKDFVYRYLPFILANGVYHSFCFIFPGCRHLWTKGLKKTILMQVIQIMYGIQMCPVSVRVSWAKLFPEDLLEEGDDDKGGETFPIQQAVHKRPKFGRKYLEMQLQAARLALQRRDSDDDSADSGTNTNRSASYTAPSSPHNKGTGPGLGDGKENPLLAMHQHHHTFSNQVKGGFGPSPQKKVGMLTDGHESQPLPITGKTANLSLGMGVSFSAPGFRRDSQVKLNRAMTGLTTMTGMDNSNDDDTSQHSTSTYDDPRRKTVTDFFSSFATQDPLTRTYLKPLPDRPKNIFACKRQNNIESLNAQEISPQMELLLSTMDPNSGNLQPKRIMQTFRRTVPIQWCPAGGTDTHHKRTVATDMHSEFALRAKKMEYDFTHETHVFHKKKLKALRKVDKALEKTLSSGPTNISRFSLDLIRKQRGVEDQIPVTHDDEVDLQEAMKLAKLNEDDDIGQFLLEL